MLVIFFLPMYEPLGGTFNLKTEHGFFDVLRFVSFGGTSANGLDLNSWPVIFMLSAVIPVILLFLFSLLGLNALSITASLMSVIRMAYALFNYGRVSGSKCAFLGVYANLSIGLWIVCALFIAPFVCSCRGPAKGRNNSASLT